MVWKDKGDKGTGRLGDWETGRLGRLGDWETGRLGDWGTRRQGDKGEIFGIRASKNPVYLITIPLKKIFMQEVY